MTRSCYNCGFMPICYVRRNFWDALLSSGALLNEGAHKKVFEAVASLCSRYEYKKEE